MITPEKCSKHKRALCVDVDVQDDGQVEVRERGQHDENFGGIPKPEGVAAEKKKEDKERGPNGVNKQRPDTRKDGVGNKQEPDTSQNLEGQKD